MEAGTVKGNRRPHLSTGANSMLPAIPKTPADWDRVGENSLAAHNSSGQH